MRGPLKFPAVPIVPQPSARVPLDLQAAQVAKGSLAFDLPKAEEYRGEQGLSNVIPVRTIGDASGNQGPQPVPGVQSLQLIRATAEELAPATRNIIAKLILPPPPANTTSVSLGSGGSAAVVTAPIEPDVKFVGAVEDVEKYGSDCSQAHNLKKGRWPFDVGAFMRVWALHTLAGAATQAHSDPQNILIVDTGFDFSYDNNFDPPIPEKYYFPKSYFWENTSDGTDPKRDTDGDGIPGNKGWSGVNLASLTRSGTTAISDPYRSHGLSVATLVLGGRDLQNLRAISDLPVRLGVASLARKLTSGSPIFTRDDITRGFLYAVGNQASVINLSLSTTLPMPGAEALIELKSRDVVIVAAAGNDGEELTDQFRIWPAERGGEPSAPNVNSAVIISVGAHDAKGKPVGFSNKSGSKVAVLAPGCMIPSFELRKDGNPPTYVEPLRIEPADVTGTSFAAPIVSFLVALIRSDRQARSPSTAKERILVGTDFSFSLKNDVYSSGIINVGKVLGYRFDIIETGSREQPFLRYGRVENKNDFGKFECSNRRIDFANVKKVAYDKGAGKVLVMFQPFSDVPQSFKTEICPDSVLDGISYSFTDTETGKTDTIKGKQALDFIPMR